MRFTTKQASTGLSLIVAFSVLLGVAVAFQGNASSAQEAACKGSHTSVKEFYENVGTLPPVSVTDIKENRLEYLFVDHGLQIGSLELEPGYSIVPTDFKDHHDKCYGIHYCRKHLVVLSVEEIDPKLCKVEKQ